jgi:hypothetical protein
MNLVAQLTLSQSGNRSEPNVGNRILRLLDLNQGNARCPT